jgi:hypothetical protein
MEDNKIEKREILALVLASGYFLDTKIPEDWKSMKEEEILDFVGEHIWFPFEGQEKEVVYGNIKKLAEDFKNYAEFCGKQSNNIKIVMFE